MGTLLLTLQGDLSWGVWPWGEGCGGREVVGVGGAWPWYFLGGDPLLTRDLLTAVAKLLLLLLVWELLRGFLGFKSNCRQCS